MIDFDAGWGEAQTADMPHSPLAVANYYLDKGDLTPMQVLKLVYIAHGWHLALTEKPLITESIQAWQYGPVISSLYHEFKGNGSGAIREKGKFYETGSHRFTTPNIDHDAPVTSLLDQVWKVYSRFTGGQLSALTHKRGTPWDIVWNQQGGKRLESAIIPDALIKTHFEEKLPS